MSKVNIDFINVNNSIETEPDNIEIEISGLKTLDKFITLSDTPLYYENGKFFKVDGNKIVYTDIQWENITGDIANNQELQEEILKLVEENSKKYTEEAVQEAIYNHDNDLNAHVSIQSKIEDNYETLDSKIELSKIDLDNKITETNNKVQENKDNINSLETYTQNLGQKIDDLTLEVEVDIKEDISKVQEDLSNATLTLNNNINTVKTELEQSITNTNELVNSNTQKISNLEENTSNKFNNLEQDIETINTRIDQEVQNINNDVDNLKERVTQNEISIDNNAQLINDTIENLKLYSKTSDFADVAFSGEYSDLLNVPQNIATNEYVQEQIQNAISGITEFSFKVVDVLPSTGESNYIYLVPQNQSENNVYSEYLWIKESNKFELIGSTETDLSGYYTSTQVDNLLSTKVDKEDGKSLISDTEIERLSTLKNYDDTEIKNLINNLDDTKQDKLTAGEGISISENVISNNITIVFRDWSV